MKDHDHYAEIMERIKIVKDRVRGVVCGQANGVYICGRPGTSKTHTVCTMLETLGVKYGYSNGHLTPIGLFDLIAENRDKVIVLDDVSAIFHQPIALQFLLAALGNTHGASGVRRVRHKTAKEDRIVDFTGGIICISNLALEGHRSEVLNALNDRVFSIMFEPSDEQLIALIKVVAANGVDGISPAECQMVCTFLLNEMHARRIRPSIRSFVDKAMKDYSLWKMNAVETHWKDLVVSNLEQQLVQLLHPTKDLSRAERMNAERRIAVDIALNYETLDQRASIWHQRTNKSQSAFYRRLNEGMSNSDLPRNCEQSNPPPFQGVSHELDSN